MSLPEHPPQPAIKNSLILRLWRDEQPNVPTWRASVEIPETGKRIGFASLEHLFAYIMDLCEESHDHKAFDGKT